MLLLVLQAAPAGAADRAFSGPLLGQRHRQHHHRRQHAADLPGLRRGLCGRTGGRCPNNNQFTMAYVDVDSDADHV